MDDVGLPLHLDANLRDATLDWVRGHPRAEELLAIPSVRTLAATSMPVMPWDLYAPAMNDLEAALGRDAMVQELPEKALDRPAFRLALEALSTVASPRVFFRFYVSVTLRRSPGVRGEWLPAPTLDAIRFRFRLEPRPTVPCEVHHRISQRFIQMLPVLLLGTSPPHVELETDGIDGTYTVHLPPSRTMWVRLRNMWNAALGRDPMSQLAYAEQEVARIRAEELDAALRDLDHRVEARTGELQALNTQLADASANKSRHLADMSHELRTPLNAIIGYAEMLAEDAQERSEQDARDLERIEVAARHLLDLVDNVLDLSKIEAGRLDVVHEPVELSALVTAVVNSLRPVLERCSNRVEVDVPSLTAMGDELRIRQVLGNLLGNAAKFTESGCIRVAAREEGDRIRVDVTDTGQGMDAATLERMFEPYQQASQPTDAPFKGTGLGLPIAQELACLMGGELTATSTPDQGSTFSLYLTVP